MITEDQQNNEQQDQNKNEQQLTLRRLGQDQNNDDR